MKWYCFFRYGDRGRERPPGPPGYGRDLPGYGRDEGPPQRRQNREEQIKNLSEQLKTLETKYQVIGLLKVDFIVWQSAVEQLGENEKKWLN